jgi:pSer/pThr/pTyr-binding forkhead associated (FHA) protein
MAILIVTGGPAKEQKFSLAGNRLTMIGRDASCSFQIVDSELSRHHLQIRHAEDQDRHFAIDFQSKNGVCVNGRKIEGESLLNHRDVITIGGTTIVYSTDDALDAQQAREAWKKLGQGHLRTISSD